MSLRLEHISSSGGVITVELHSMEGETTRALRLCQLDTTRIEPGEEEHVYWDPVVDSAERPFALQITTPVGRGAQHVSLTASAAKLIYSSPEPYDALPRALLFSPVSQCNLNCVHCISRPTRAKLRVASERTWEAVQQVTRGEDFLHLAMDYSGDILVDERRRPGTLARIIAMDAAFRIDTNATCLDHDIIEMLLGSRLREINFSIDSMDPEVYPKIRRGSLPLPEVLANVARFMSAKRAAGREIHTIISFVLMRSNAASIKPALSFAREHGIDHVSVVPMLAFTVDMLEEMFVWDEGAYAALYQELTAEAARVGVALAMQPPVTQWREDDIHAPCEVPWATAAITANGDVMACCMPGTVIGNLNTQSLREIWAGPEFAAFRRRVNSPDPPASCRNCGMARVRNNRSAYAPVLAAKTPN